MEINQNQISWELFKLMYWWTNDNNKVIKLKQIYKNLMIACDVSNNEKNQKYANGNNKFNAKVRAARANCFGDKKVIEIVKPGVWKLTEYGCKKFQELQVIFNSPIYLNYKIVE